jgi:hypothetical protein
MFDARRRGISSFRSIDAILVVLIVGLIGLGLWLNSGSVDRSRSNRTESSETSESGRDSKPRGHASTGPLRQDEQWVGGIRRPVTDLPSETRASEHDQESADDRTISDAETDEWDYGRTPAVELDANDQVANVSIAIENRQAEPDRYAKAVSPLATPEAFDRTRYTQDAEYRRSYLKMPQPSRVFAPAQPGEDVPQIRRMSPPFQKAPQGKTVKLRVKAIPGAPVTFTSFDLGRFENELTTITVEADSTGMAEVGFYGPPGTIDDVNILVASPVTSGQVRLVVHVTRPSS